MSSGPAPHRGHAPPVVSAAVAAAAVLAVVGALGDRPSAGQTAPAPTSAAQAPARGEWANADFHDAHFHLTNYIQEGIDVRRFLEIMGTRVGRTKHDEG